MITEIITAAAVGASFVFVSDKLKTKLMDMAAGNKAEDRKKLRK